MTFKEFKAICAAHGCTVHDYQGVPALIVIKRAPDNWGTVWRDRIPGMGAAELTRFYIPEPAPPPGVEAAEVWGGRRF